MLHVAHPETRPALPSVVFLHGWLGSTRDWDAVRRTLPGWALDLPGHGASLGLPDAAYTLAGAADAVVAMLDALALPAPVLVGYSMGGRVALTVARRHPGRLRALVLESVSPGLHTDAARAARRAADRDRAARFVADRADFLATWYRLPLFASLAAEPGRVEALIAERLVGDAAEQARALRGLSVAHQPSYWDHLAALPPTLALAGALDAKYVGVVEAMGSTVDTRVIPGAGHNVHREQPEAFVAAVRAWLTAVL